LNAFNQVLFCTAVYSNPVSVSANSHSILGKLNFPLESRFGSSAVRIYESTMPKNMEDYAVASTQMAIKTKGDYGDSCRYVGKKLNEKYGGLWSCSMGPKYGYWVYYNTYYLSFYLDDNLICLFKH